MKPCNPTPEHLHTIFMRKDISLEEKEVIIRQALIDFPQFELGVLDDLYMILEQQEKYEECLEICDKLIQLNTDAEEIAENYFHKGIIYQYMDNNDDAYPCYEKSIEINPSVDNIFSMAEMFYEDEDWVHALKLYEMFAHDDTDKDINLEKLFSCAHASSMLNNKEKAIDYYKEYLTIRPNDIAVLHELAIVYSEQNKWEEAKKLFKKCTEVDTTDEKLFYNLGICYNKIGDHLMEMHCYIEAIKIKPDFAEAYKNMGRVAILEEGDAKQAIEYLEKAIEITKEDDPLLFELYFTLLAINKHITNFERTEYYQEKLMSLFGYDVSKEEDDEEEDLN